jgi:hypothetical protein
MSCQFLLANYVNDVLLSNSYWLLVIGKPSQLCQSSVVRCLWVAGRGKSTRPLFDAISRPLFDAISTFEFRSLNFELLAFHFSLFTFTSR